MIHCKDEEAANKLKHAIEKWMNEIGLRLNEEKTKIVYCKDYRRTGKHDKVQFGFLGYSFQPRAMRSKLSGKSIMTVTHQFSKDNQKKIRNAIRETVSWRNTHQTIEPVAEKCT